MVDAANYRPSDEVLERLLQVDFVAIVGPSGAGKTTLINGAIAADPNLHLVRVTTSRPPRPDERDGFDYHFRSRDEISRRLQNNEMVQIAPVAFDELYATAPEDYSLEGRAIMAVLADAMLTFQALPFKSFQTIFIVPPGFATWQQRLGLHTFTDEQRAKRISEAKRSIAFGLATSDASYVINGDLPKAQDDFIKLLQHDISAELADEQHAARIVLQDLRQHLDEA